MIFTSTTTKQRAEWAWRARATRLAPPSPASYMGSPSPPASPGRISILRIPMISACFPARLESVTRSTGFCIECRSHPRYRLSAAPWPLFCHLLHRFGWGVKGPRTRTTRVNSSPLDLSPCHPITLRPCHLAALPSSLGLPPTVLVCHNLSTFDTVENDD